MLEFNRQVKAAVKRRLTALAHADQFILLPLSRISDRHAKHFLKGASNIFKRKIP